eukprot:1978003-Pleurochrysis_carterae.AAC.3
MTDGETVIAVVPCPKASARKWFVEHCQKFVRFKPPAWIPSSLCKIASSIKVAFKVAHIAGHVALSSLDIMIDESAHTHLL